MRFRLLPLLSSTRYLVPLESYHKRALSGLYTAGRWSDGTTVYISSLASYWVGMKTFPMAG